PVIPPFGVGMDANGSSVCNDHSPTNSQTEAATGSAPVTFFRGMETLEYFFAFILRNARSMVANSDDNFIVFFDAFDVNAGAWRGEFDCVINDIKNCLL